MPAKSSALWQIVFLTVLGVTLVLISAETARAEGTSFRDDFDSFDSSMWIRSDHVLGLTDFDPDNVSVANGYLREKIPAHTTDGAEIEAMDYYGYGTYKARIKTADAPSSITGFYLYRSPDFYYEIDIAVHNDGSGNVEFVTDADGQRTHHVSKQAAFDPSADFHTHRFDYLPRAVRFYGDGALMQVWRN